MSQPPDFISIRSERAGAKMMQSCANIGIKHMTVSMGGVMLSPYASENALRSFFRKHYIADISELLYGE